jgi:hypothetical protein
MLEYNHGSLVQFITKWNSFRTKKSNLRMTWVYHSVDKHRASRSETSLANYRSAHSHIPQECNLQWNVIQKQTPPSGYRGPARCDVCSSDTRHWTGINRYTDNGKSAGAGGGGRSTVPGWRNNLEDGSLGHRVINNAFKPWTFVDKNYTHLLASNIVVVFVSCH